MTNSAILKFGSSLRIRSPEETLDLVRPYFSNLGISRVTDTTRMDRLGIPVFASIRPRGKTLRVHAGKGIEAIDAKVGAAMEALEYAIAEPEASSWLPVETSVAELLEQIPGVNFVDFAPRIGVVVEPEDPIHCVSSEELSSKRKFLIPAQLVFLPYLPQGLKNFFGGTTNGLASGNSIEEASVHAIFEVLERDAISMNKAKDRSYLVDPDSLPKIFQAYHQNWSQLGISLAVRYIENSFCLPCFQAYITEDESDTVNISMGQGLHSDPFIAISRAICEAAQSRLSHIHGGRDDITHFYSKYSKWEPRERAKVECDVKQHAFNSEKSVTFEEVVNLTRITELAAPNAIADILANLLEYLRLRGFSKVYRYEFKHSLPSISVVKIIIPTCEHIEHNLKRMGPRLLNMVTCYE